MDLSSYLHAPSNFISRGHAKQLCDARAAVLSESSRAISWAGAEAYPPLSGGAGNHWNEQRTRGYHVVKMPLPICYSREVIRLVLSIAGKAIANRVGRT